MLQDAKDTNSKDRNGEYLLSEVEYRKKLLDIYNKIHAAINLDEILVGLIDEIALLFKAERLTIYVVDGKKQELVSRFKIGDEIEEIRIPISSTSIAGYSAFFTTLSPDTQDDIIARTEHTLNF